MSNVGEELVNELRALAERVARLEHTAERSQADVTAAIDGDQFWALAGLQSRLAGHPETAAGAVMLVGSLTLPNGAPVAWQQAEGTAALWDQEWSDRADTFAALGHPVRLELLRHILAGTRATADLAQLESLGTTGQLHHHLRQLVAAGWVKQSGRGHYDVPAARIVPLLACLVGVER